MSKYGRTFLSIPIPAVLSGSFLLNFRGKSVRVFVFGDYELLCNLYGISGASGEAQTNTSCIVMALNTRPRLPLILSSSWAWLSTGVSLVYLYTCSLTTGCHCCLWCKFTYKHLQHPRAVRSTSPGRSLQTLDHDLHTFLTTGMGNIKMAKSYNVIRERLWCSLGSG